MEASTEQLRELSDWEPALGVVSVYLAFDPADRTGAWRTELRNGLERIRAEAEGAEHEPRIAVRATAGRLQERYEDDETRPPPRGEAGFVEVSEAPGREHWWTSGVAPAAPGVQLSPQPLLAGLLELAERGAPHGVAVISSEQVRLLRFAAGQLEQIEEWEMSYFERDWRERKSQSTNDPARAHGVSSSGRDQYDQRLEHNRERFLAEAGKLAGERFADRGIGDALVIGPAGDWTEFGKGIAQTAVRAESADRDDLISVPTGELSSHVEAAIERGRAKRDGAVVARALGDGDGRPGALGVQDTAEALGEGRVEQLVVDAAIGAAAEPLVRDALASSAAITIVRDELAEKLARAEGVAAILRY
ncbi:MAG TPA: VLRF1 family aeRF1-type release factor [Solirubrobacterales bacterium]|nr:VLRF1 family aeRF1-type release factor [Solirubrobacterales bacterium]